MSQNPRDPSRARWPAPKARKTLAQIRDPRPAPSDGGSSRRLSQESTGSEMPARPSKERVCASARRPATESERLRLQSTTGLRSVRSSHRIASRVDGRLYASIFLVLAAARGRRDHGRLAQG